MVPWLWTQGLPHNSRALEDIDSGHAAELQFSERALSLPFISELILQRR